MTAGSKVPSRNAVIFDERRALAAAGEDVAIAREITGLFLVDLPRRLRALREAVHQEALDKVAALAHGLRGSAALFGSDAGVEATLQLELLAKQGERDALTDALGELERVFRKLAEAVADRFIDPSESLPSTEHELSLSENGGKSP